MQMVGLTVAATNMEEMVRFYNAVFSAGLKPTVHIGAEQFYAGELCGMKLTFCPNSIAGVARRAKIGSSSAFRWRISRR